MSSSASSDSVSRLNQFKNKGKDASVGDVFDSLSAGSTHCLYSSRVSTVFLLTLSGAEEEEDGGQCGAPESEERRADLKKEECQLFGSGG